MQLRFQAPQLLATRKGGGVGRKGTEAKRTPGGTQPPGWRDA